MSPTGPDKVEGGITVEHKKLCCDKLMPHDSNQVQKSYLSTKVILKVTRSLVSFERILLVEYACQKKDSEIPIVLLL